MLLGSCWPLQLPFYVKWEGTLMLIPFVMRDLDNFQRSFGSFTAGTEDSGDACDCYSFPVPHKTVSFVLSCWSQASYQALGRILWTRMGHFGDLYELLPPVVVE